MKKVLQSILSAMLLVSLGACGTKNTEAPESVIERYAMEYYRTREHEKLEGYQGSEVTVLGHDVNEKDHTDEVMAKVTQSFPYGKVEHKIRLLFEYNRSNDLWNKINDESGNQTTTVLDKEKIIGEYCADTSGGFYLPKHLYLNVIDVNDRNVAIEGQVTVRKFVSAKEYAEDVVDISGTYPMTLIDKYTAKYQYYDVSLPESFFLRISAVSGIYIGNNTTAAEFYKLNTPVDFDFDPEEAAEEQTGTFSTNINFIGNEKMIRYWIENDNVMMYDGVYQNLYEEETGAISHLTVKSGCIQEIYNKTSASAQKIGEVYDLTPLAYYETVKKNGCNWYRIDKDKAFWINDANNGINLK